MAELKNLTVRALRDLARKVLGRGHSKLKTKGELVAALQAAGKNASAAAGKAAARVKAATGRAAEAAGKAVAKTKAKAKAKAAGKPARAKAAPPAKGKAQAPAKAKAARAAPAAAAEPDESEAAEAADARRDEPDADGYFVARVRGEEAVRDAPHPMTEGALEEPRAPAPPPRRGHRPEHHFEERLGELPQSYEDDVVCALPRDPRTLFLYWDHHAATVREGFQGLEGARAQLWVFGRTDGGGWERVRVVDFALESRSWYVHDLEPGRTYRAEIHLVDRHGADRLLPAATNEMQLPPFGPSPVVDDRFMRIPWDEPLGRLLRHVREGGPFPEELRAILAHLSDWSRFVTPAAALAAGSGAGAAGGPGGRPSGPSGAPTSPSSPFGPYGYGSGSGEGR